MLAATVLHGCPSCTDFTTIIRVSLEVSADDNHLTGQYTIDIKDATGAGAGEAGLVRVTGTRLTVEGPGTPVMSMEELFQSFQGTPETTPAS